MLGFDGTQRAPALVLTLDHNDAYLLRFLHGGHEIGARVIAPRANQGMRTETVSAPENMLDGFDRIAVRTLYGDGRYSLGSVRSSRAKASVTAPSRERAPALYRIVGERRRGTNVPEHARKPRDQARRLDAIDGLTARYVPSAEARAQRVVT